MKLHPPLPQSTLQQLKMHIFPELSPREIQYLYWRTMGLNRTEISEYSETNISTVKTHFERITRKLNCDEFRQVFLIYHTRMNIDELITWRLQTKMKK